MTIEQYNALTSEERTTARLANQEATRVFVKTESGRTIGYTYQTLGGFYRGYSFLASCGVGPFDSRNGATDYVVATAATIGAQPPALRRALSRLT